MNNLILGLHPRLWSETLPFWPVSVWEIWTWFHSNLTQVQLSQVRVWLVRDRQWLTVLQEDGGTLIIPAFDSCFGRNLNSYSQS